MRSRILLFSMLIGALSTAAYAQRQMRQGGGNYNPATEVTLTGTVAEVKNMPSPGRRGGGVHLVVGTQSGPMTVHVGPASFVSARNMSFADGDALTIVGSKVTMMGQEVVIAREIRKGDQVLMLRDAKGFPLWSGHGGTP